MKKIYFLVSVGFLMTFSASTFVMAQSCTAQSPVLGSNMPVSNTTVTGNSCASPAGNGDTSISTLCNSTSNTGPVIAYSWNYGSGSTSGSITVTPTGASATFNPAILVADGADCSTALNATFCDNGPVDSAGAGGAETIALSSLTKTNTTYFLFITSLSGTANQKCGPFNIATGTLPVKLQSFSIN